MSIHMKKTCCGAFFHIRNIRRIKKYLSLDSLRIIVYALITSRLDFCNSFIWTTPNVQISKLERVQNAAARLTMDIPMFPQVTPGLYELHMLPITYWIKFKILILPFKSIHGLEPS